GISAAMVAMSDWPKQEGQRTGDGWVIRIPASRRGRVCLYDANAAKSRGAGKLRQPLGEPGALTLFGSASEAHRLLADHLTSEYPVRTTGRGREVEEFKLRPNRENHFWDCLCGNFIAAGTLGLTPGGLPRP